MYNLKPVQVNGEQHFLNVLTTAYGTAKLQIEMTTENIKLLLLSPDRSSFVPENASSMGVLERI